MDESASRWQVQGKKGEKLSKSGGQDDGLVRGQQQLLRLLGLGAFRNTYKRGQILHGAACCEGCRAVLGYGDNGGEWESNEFIAERAKKAMRNFFELFRLVTAKPL